MKAVAKALKGVVNALGYVRPKLSTQDLSLVLQIAKRSLETDHETLSRTLGLPPQQLANLASRLADPDVATVFAPMPQGHALEVLSKLAGVKGWNDYAATRKQTPGQTLMLDGSVDCAMADEVEDDRVWVTIGAISAYLKRTHEGVIVDLFATGAEDEESLASCACLFVDAEEVLRDSGHGWAIYSANEAAAGGSGGWWNTEEGWMDDEEYATVFPESAKTGYELPMALGQDACWVALSEAEPCPYCGSRACTDEHPCDGRAGDIDGLIADSALSPDQKPD